MMAIEKKPEIIQKMAESIQPNTGNESNTGLQTEREKLERENEELKKKLAQFGIFPDSTFLPLKPDTSNARTYSTEVMVPSSTIPSIGTSSSSYLELPQMAKSQAGVKDMHLSSLKENAQRLMMKADLLLERYYDHDPAVVAKTDEDPEKTLSDYVLSSPVNERFSITPKRYSDGGRQVEIGRRNTRTSQNEYMMNQQARASKTEDAGALINKKLNFEDSSDEELKQIQERVKTLERRRTLDSKENCWKARTVGEIAFQLDRRILQHIFSHRRRLYGFTVRNIDEKIKEISWNDSLGGRDEQKSAELHAKKDELMKILRQCADYDPKYHGIFSELLVNKYGILKVHPRDWNEELRNLQNYEYLSKVVLDSVDAEYIKDADIILRALKSISLIDKKPILMW